MRFSLTESLMPTRPLVNTENKRVEYHLGATGHPLWREGHAVSLRIILPPQAIEDSIYRFPHS